MPLAPGDKLGPFEILGSIGAGGMGSVYKAHDPRLNRTVAIKVAAAQFSERFEREAKAIAALNHPNICQIYDVGPNYLVMEYIEGASPKGPLPLDKALDYAAQIADALDAAHTKKITHRDLKPANILVTKQGVVKLLDFGLAKMEKAIKVDDATLTMGLTVQGTILGTLLYMSPEQISGQEADARSDIFAYGLILYEMLTGKRAFDGTTAASIMGAILERPAPSIADVAPAALDRVLKRCLEKDPEKRWQSARDLKSALELVTLPVPEAPPAVAAPPPPQRSWLWQAIAGVSVVVATVALWGWLKPTPAEPRPLMHFITAAPQGIFTQPLAVSPDGLRVAYIGVSDNRLFVRSMTDPVAKPVPGTDRGEFPVFSPDGQWLAFLAGPAPYQLRKVPLGGGAVVTLANGIPQSYPLSWGADGTILLGGSVILRISESGGQPVEIARVTSGSGEIGFAGPELLPGGAYILASVLTEKGGARELPVVAIDVKTGTRKVLMEAAGDTRFLPSGSRREIGHLVYAHNGTLFAAAFDTTTLQVGPALPVWEGLLGLGALAPQGFSRSGTWAYPTGTADSFGLGPSTLTWVDRQGGEQVVTPTVRNHGNPRVSPDGTRIAFSLEDPQTIEMHLWLYDVVRRTSTRLTYQGLAMYPAWTADGKGLLYTSQSNPAAVRGRVGSIAADGSGQPIFLMDEGIPARPTSVSPDGKLAIGTRGNDVWLLPLDDKAAKPQPFLDNRFLRAEFQFSPDGRWVAYESNESGRNEVYVSPFPGPGGKSQVSTEGGAQPRWNRNGRELFFRSGDKLMAVDVETGAAFRAGAPKVLFEKPSTDYDVAPDGKRFLMLKPTAGEVSRSEIHIILNWFDDLRKKVPLEK